MFLSYYGYYGFTTLKCWAEKLTAITGRPSPVPTQPRNLPSNWNSLAQALSLLMTLGFGVAFGADASFESLGPSWRGAGDGERGMRDVHRDQI